MLLLTPEELVALTGKHRSDAQVKVLRAMGIEHRPRPDGTLAVSRAHVEHLLGGDQGAKVKEISPDWSSLAQTA